MNYYEHHLGDYLRATAHLSMLEDGAYRRLLDVYYSSEKPLPGAIKTIWRLARARSVTEKKAVTEILAEFFLLDDDGFHKRRCDEEIARFHDKSKKAKSSANARWAKENGEAPTNIRGSGAPPNEERSHSECNANAPPNAMRTHSEGNAPQSPVPNHQTNTEDRRQGTARKRATPPPDRPADVAEQTWGDWLQLRKGKRAAVSTTVLAEARNEAGKAGLTLERFLAVWCARGSQGLQADWLRPEERKATNGNHAEPDWRREQRERTQQAAPYAAARTVKTIDVEAVNALAKPAH